MICSKCGAANDERERSCGYCHAEFSLPEASAADEVKPSWDLTQISERNIFPENLANGRLKIIRVLDRGGMGDILLAEDSNLKRKVAIKSLNIDWLGERYAQTRFRREALAVSLLNHPNICAIYEIVSENGREYIVMEYVDGVTLDKLQKMKALTPDHIVDIALQITEGMIAAQGQHIVHLDIKPGNIMIDKFGKVMILDFGLAEFDPAKAPTEKPGGPKQACAKKDIVLGTVAYMSPEQTEGHDPDGRSDIFSFGVVLYELLERKNPFSDLDDIVTLFNISHKEIKLSQNVPQTLQGIVHKALQKNRERRYNDFSEIKKTWQQHRQH